MAITLRIDKELQGEPPMTTKEVDADVVTQTVDEEVAKNYERLST